MTSEESLDWPTLIARFDLSGKWVESSPHGNGHINDTFVVTVAADDAPGRYLFQRINNRIFRDVPALMDNIARVTTHVPGELDLIPACDGSWYVRDDTRAWWRAYTFIEDATTYDVVEQAHQAREAAYSFGRFQQQLIDLPGPRLHETIPGFHDTRQRFDQFLAARRTDFRHRATEAADEIAFAHERRSMVDHLPARIARGEIFDRITHNDTKINNVLLDDVTGKGRAVIDLDTVMPGLVLHDFGDMIRTATNAAREDETDLSQVEARMDVFDALAEGYLAATRHFLVPAEIEELVFAGCLITFETGLRFLTDHLAGDLYFKTRHAGHNLDRARCQFALMRSLESHRETMTTIIQDRLASGES